MKSKTKNIVNSPMFFKSRRSKRYIHTPKPLTRKTSLTKRKFMAREFKKYFALDRIPCAIYDSIKNLIDRACYEYDYDNYAGW